MHSCIDFDEAYTIRFWVSASVHPPLRVYTHQETHIPVTRLSASLLSPWLFPDKCSCPLDSTPLSSGIMANYQEAVCWKDAASNYICLQTTLRSKHMLWNKLPSEMKCIQKNLQSFMWMLRNAQAMTVTFCCCVTRYCLLLEWNEQLMKPGGHKWNVLCV